MISHGGCIIQLVESYRAILEQAQSVTGVTYLPAVNGNSNGSTGGRPTSASSVNRGAGQVSLTQEMMDGMLQNATYGMQMLDVALRAKSLQGSGPPTSQHYPQQQQHPSQHPSQPSLNSTSSLTASSNQVQATSSTTSVNTGPSSSSYGYNTNSHPHSHSQQQHSNSNSSSPRILKDGSSGGGVKGGIDDGGRKVKSEGSMDKGVPANGTSANSTTTTTTANAATAVSTGGATGASAGSTAPISGDRSKRQVGF